VVKKAHVPPAKKRYDEKHPTVSFRASREHYDRLKGVLNKQGKTIGQFFRESLEIEERNYSEAYWRGYRKAKERYAVYATCMSCGEPIAIDDQQMKEDIYLSILEICLHRECKLMNGYQEDEVRRVGSGGTVKGKKAKKRS
jgi:hypothetical protein